MHPSVRARELWPFFALRAVEAVAWHPYYDLPCLDWLIPLVRRAGYQVNVWTVDEPERMRTLAALGATGIITNRPDLARQVLQG
ncbi:MAG: glycerophosphodiester phosphodiesterase, partial [Chloroflexaceae bacterium]